LRTYHDREEEPAEREPLITPAFSGRSTPVSTGLRHIASPSPPPRRSIRRRPAVAESSSSNSSLQQPVENLRPRTMEETKPTSKFRRFADKLAVEEEPGLSTSQLMLTNYDLKPVEVSSSFVMLPFALRPSAACFGRGCRNPILKPVSFVLFGDICSP
jgi:hypothetical protein